jgi:hypothetical protein
MRTTTSSRVDVTIPGADRSRDPHHRLRRAAHRVDKRQRLRGPRLPGQASPCGRHLVPARLRADRGPDRAAAPNPNQPYRSPGPVHCHFASGFSGHVSTVGIMIQHRLIVRASTIPACAPDPNFRASPGPGEPHVASDRLAVQIVYGHLKNSVSPPLPSSDSLNPLDSLNSSVAGRHALLPGSHSRAKQKSCAWLESIVRQQTLVRHSS